MLNSVLTFRNQKKLAGPFAPGLTVTPKLFAVTHDAKIIFSGGLWDNSIRVYSAAKGKTIQNIVRHTGKKHTVAWTNNYSGFGK